MCQFLAGLLSSLTASVSPFLRAVSLYLPPLVGLSSPPFLLPPASTLFQCLLIWVKCTSMSQSCLSFKCTTSLRGACSHRPFSCLQKCLPEMGWCCARDEQKSLLKRYWELGFITKESLTYKSDSYGATNSALVIGLQSGLGLNWKRFSVSSGMEL